VIASEANINAHKTAPILDHPDGSVTTPKIANGAVTSAKLASGAATDTVIGNRTADPAQVPSSNGPGTLTQWFSWIANRIKAILGTTNWWDAPPTTLTAAKSHIDDTVKHITAAERTTWNAKETPAGAQAKVDAHANATTGVHGATSAATANTIVQRDSSGRFKAATPAANDDVARKIDVDNAVAAHENKKNNPHNVTSEQVTIIPYRAATESGDTIPNGITIMYTPIGDSQGIADGYPANIGVIVTFKFGGYRTIQIFYESSAGGLLKSWMRKWVTGQGWSQFVENWHDGNHGSTGDPHTQYALKTVAQMLKLTQDDGKGLRISGSITKLSDVRTPGMYYMTTTESNTFTDHPRPGIAGWYLIVSQNATDDACVQFLIRNSVTYEIYYRALYGTANGTIGDWAKIPLSNINYSSGTFAEMNMGDNNWARVADIRASSKPRITWERSTARDAAFLVFNQNTLASLFEVLDDGTSKTVKLRLSSTTDASETSTNHAFQIGADNGQNTRIDTNEILFVDNGVLATGYIQGNQVTLANSLRGNDGGIPQANVNGWKNIATTSASTGTHINISSSAPSGGTDGDIWIQY